jgi:hypothetical protein
MISGVHMCATTNIYLRGKDMQRAQDLCAGKTILGLASFWVPLWCLGLPANSRVLLNPLPRQSTLPLLVVALSSFGSHTP